MLNSKIFIKPKLGLAGAYYTKIYGLFNWIAHTVFFIVIGFC